MFVIAASVKLWEMQKSYNKTWYNATAMRGVGQHSAIRISRIVSETLRLGLDNVCWFVLGDDDTVFISNNVVRVLQKYDHTQFYYIRSLSESHLQKMCQAWFDYKSQTDRFISAKTKLNVGRVRRSCCNQIDQQLRRSVLFGSDRYIGSEIRSNIDMNSLLRPEDALASGYAKFSSQTASIGIRAAVYLPEKYHVHIYDCNIVGHYFDSCGTGS
uniref:Fringe-like glycosyltransferase domain-containing protein n=1 Tax=Kalanchoe fedtschenkoi TaxID=63787 RepID=A0A7N0TLC4_KALFE